MRLDVDIRGDSLAHPAPLSIRARPGGSGGQVDLVAKDASLQLTNTGTCVEPDLVDQSPPQPLIGRQGIGLATGPVLRRHQLGDEALVQWVRLDGLLQLGEHLSWAVRHLVVEQLVHRFQSALFELYR